MSWILYWKLKVCQSLHPKSDDCWLVHVEDVGLLVLLVLGVLGIVLGELGVDAGCHDIVEVGDIFAVECQWHNVWTIDGC